MHRNRASQLLAVFSLSCRSEGSGHDLEASLPGKRGLVGIQKGDEMAIVSPGQNFRADRLGRAGKFKMVVAGCFGQLPDFSGRGSPAVWYARRARYSAEEAASVMFKEPTTLEQTWKSWMDARHLL